MVGRAMMTQPTGLDLEQGPLTRREIINPIPPVPIPGPRRWPFQAPGCSVRPSKCLGRVVGRLRRLRRLEGPPTATGWATDHAASRVPLPGATWADERGKGKRQVAPRFWAASARSRSPGRTRSPTRRVASKSGAVLGHARRGITQARPSRLRPAALTFWPTWPNP
jgi:hypothetical protein